MIYNKIMTGLFETLAHKPLADKMRPARLDEVVGQSHLLGEKGPLARMIQNQSLYFPIVPR